MVVLKGVIRVVKQYTVENAYTGNEKVYRYTDGKLELYEVMSYWEVDGYCTGYHDGCNDCLREITSKGKEN